MSVGTCCAQVEAGTLVAWTPTPSGVPHWQAGSPPTSRTVGPDNGFPESPWSSGAVSRSQDSFALVPAKESAPPGNAARIRKETPSSANAMTALTSANLRIAHPHGPIL